MTITPNTNFTVGQVFTANQANRFPRGVMGLQTLTTTFATAATHTTFQDNGATLTITEVSGRLYKIVYQGYPYPNGGLQGISYRILRAGANIEQYLLPQSATETGNAYPFHFEYVHEATQSGSVTFKLAMAAAFVNTQVSDYGDASFKRQFWIEDIGEA
jgi:hypothetical protein